MVEHQQRRHIHGVDLTRFAAAALVMAFHYLKVGGVPASGGPGWVGVEVFFVISGYVIAFSAEGASPAAFAKARFLRLAPAVWLCAPIAAVIMLRLAWYPDVWIRAARAMVLWPTGPWIDAAYWTLPIEVLFYALVWLMLLLRVRNGVERLAWTLGIISSAYWIAAALLGLPGKFSPAITYTMLGYGCYFAVGAVYYAAGRSGWTIARGVVIGVSLIAGAIQIWDWNGAEHTGAALLLAELLWLGLVAVIVASVTWNRRISAALGPVAGAVRVIGLATFPLYLIHGSLADWLRPKLGDPLAVALTVAFSIAFVIVAEPPMKRALRWMLSSASRFLPTRRTSLSASPSR